jgi:hypothetical protein
VNCVWRLETCLSFVENRFVRIIPIGMVIVWFVKFL